MNPGILEEVYDYAAMRAALHPRHLALGGEPEDF